MKLISVNLGSGRAVTAGATVRPVPAEFPVASSEFPESGIGLLFSSLATGNSQLGTTRQHYDVICMGIACAGTWSGDARDPVVVSDPPAKLRGRLIPLEEAQQAHRDRRDRVARPRPSWTQPESRRDLPLHRSRFGR